MKNPVVSVLTFLLAVFVVSCDASTHPPPANQDEFERILSLTAVPVDGVVFTDGDGNRSMPPNAREARFAMFATDIPEGTAYATFVDGRGAESLNGLPRAGAFLRGDRMLRRVLLPEEWDDLTAPPQADHIEPCHLADYKNQPGALDYIRQSDKFKRFEAYGHCYDHLVKTVEHWQVNFGEGYDSCFVVSWSSFNEETEVFDLHSEIRCGPNQILM